MRAAVMRALGEPPHVADMPEPASEDGEEVVRVLACPLTNLDRLRAAGTHFAAPTTLPAVCGATGAGVLADGSRVLFRSVGGAMAEWAVALRSSCVPIPDGVDAALAAAAHNPGVSAWNALTWRAKLRPGERVLVLGATGSTGRIAVQIAKHLGAGRVVGAGRDPQALASLRDLGADATIQLDQPDDALRATLRAEGGFDVVLDYLWGHPTEVFISTLGRPGMELRCSRTRLVQLGVMAGTHVHLPADVLRSSGLEILGSGTGNTPPMPTLTAMLGQVLDLLAAGGLCMAVNKIPLTQLRQVWDLDQRVTATVLIP